MKRTFIYTDAKSNKFWSIELTDDAKTYTVAYGKVGTTGQTTSKSFPDAAACKKVVDKLIAEKTAKGYIEQTENANETPAASDTASKATAPVKKRPAAKTAMPTAPTPIRTIEEFLAIAPKGQYVLQNDIDFAGRDFDSQPLVDKFQGTLDGGGHALRNFKFSGSFSYRVNDRWGVFGLVQGPTAKISNLRIVGAQLHGTNKTGALVGCLANGAVLENCSVEDTTCTTSHANGGHHYCGTLCGVISGQSENPCRVSHCRIVNCRTTWAGIVGQISGAILDQCSIEKCHFDYKYKANTLAYSIEGSTASGCKVINSTHGGTDWELFAEERNSTITDCVIVENKPIQASPIETLRALLASHDAYEQLKDRETLSLWGLHTGDPVDFPEVVSRLTKLKHLNLGNNSWKSIPDSITNLQNLEELHLDCALSYVKELPDLSKLKNLKILCASGAPWFSTRPPADPALLKHFFKIESLELLRINSWGRLNHYNRELRPALALAHLKGIGKLRNLKQLVLDDNQLETLPDEVTALPLDYLGVRKNHLEAMAINALAAAKPTAFLDTRDNTPAPGKEPPIQIAIMLRRGYDLSNDYMSYKSLTEALVLFTHVLNHYTQPGVQPDVHNYRRALYGAVYVCGRILYNCSGQMTAEEIQHIRTEGFKAADFLVRYLQQHWSPMHFGADSDFQREAMRLAANTIGWAYVQNNVCDQAQLESIIKIVQLGVDNIESLQHYYIYDTMVRLLLNAGRTEEAYEIIKQCLQKRPDFADFAQFKKDKNYLAWATKQ